MSSLDQPMTPEDAFGQISRAASAGRPLAALFRTLADVAYQALPHSSAVSITVVRRNVSGTAAFRGRHALALDEVQYRWGDGPCVRAATTDQVVVIKDVGADDRWPEFTSSAARAGVRSVMSVPLTNDVVRGSLNIYAGDTAILDDDAIGLAQALARHFASAINEGPAE